MTWGSPGSGRRADRASRRSLTEGEADDCLEWARVLYESLSDAQLARLKRGDHRSLAIPRNVALGLVRAVEGAYIDEDEGD